MTVSDTQSKTEYNRRFKPFRLRYVSALIVAVAVIMMPAISGYAGEEITVITIHAKRYEFVPAEITLTAGKSVRLVFIADDVPHGISVVGLLSDVDIDPYEPTAVVITPSKIGDFAGECSRYCGGGHERMKFVVHVLE